MLGSPGLPLKLKTALQTAKHFLFIGFDFDKWYSQLLLRLLSGEKAIRKFAIDPTPKEDNTNVFLVKQFGIEFIDDEKSFLEELFRQCKEQGLWRDIVESQTPNATRIIKHIQNGEVLKALNFAKDQVKSEDLKDGITVLLAQFNNLETQKKNGTIDSRDYSVQWNKIIDGLMNLIKDNF
jgi:hypothetical protein